MTTRSATLLATLRGLALLPAQQIDEAARLAAAHRDADAFAAELVRRGLLTPYQSAELTQGRAAALVVGPYVLADRIGQGGMGEVFRARHAVMGREVALERVLASRLGTSGAVERFLREVRAASMLSHPNVVQVFDAGEAGGSHYLAMELLAGVTLSDLLSRRGPLPVAEAVDHVRQACVGMQHAHDKGLVHRDLKPANLILDGEGRVKILDLGLALVSDGKALTKLASLIGTVDYVAPEQVKDPHNVDGRADVYSLGCTLYHLLTGKTPFDEAHPAARPAMHVGHAPTPLEQRRPKLPPDVCAVVRKMMAKKRRKRFQTPGEAADALAELLRQDRVTAAVQAAGAFDDLEGSAVVRPARPVRRKRRPWAVAVGAAALLAVAVTLGVVATRGDRKAVTVKEQTDSIPAGGPGRLALRDADKGRPTADLPPPPPPPPGPARVAGPGKAPSADADKGKPRDADWGKPPPPEKVVVKAKPADPEKVVVKPKPAERGPEVYTVHGMKFARIPKGTFRMGSPKEEFARGQLEVPHEVEITNDYWLGVYEVTQKQWAALMGYNPCFFSINGRGKVVEYGKFGPPAGAKAALLKEKIANTDDFPVENISWEELQSFLGVLNLRKTGKAGLVFRLPTEAEWERACRGTGKYRTFAHGDTLSSKDANFKGTFPYGDVPVGDFLERTTKVGSYAPNEFGLYDMHGNASEWCNDWFDHHCPKPIFRLYYPRRARCPAAHVHPRQGQQCLPSDSPSRTSPSRPLSRARGAPPSASTAALRSGAKRTASSSRPPASIATRGSLGSTGGLE